MLCIGRKNGEWGEVTHRSGDVLRIGLERLAHGQGRLLFEDPARNFEILREELKARGGPSSPAPEVPRCE